MIWFKKNKAQVTDDDKVAEGIARLILGVQRRWASWMNRQAGNCPPRLRGLILFMLLLLMSVIGATLLVGGFNSNKNIIATASIQVPAMIDEKNNLHDSSEINAAYERIKRARQYLDSLAQSTSGKQRLDSLNKARPGLNDSIRMEELLYKQLKQKYGE